MGLIEVQQNTEEWLELRRRYLGASDAPVLAGFNQYRDIQHLWRDKLGLNPPEKESYAATRGKQLESVALDIYNFEFGAEAKPTQVVSAEVPFMSASLDGFFDNTVVEIKCPMRKSDIVKASHGIIKPDHYPQLQHQLFVTKASYVDYVVFDGLSQIYVNRVFPDLKYQRNLVRISKWFWHQVINKIEIKDYSIILTPKEAK